MRHTRIWLTCAAAVALWALCGLRMPASASRIAVQTPAAARTTIDLNGEWLFALDATGEGEQDRWFAADLNIARWERVQVPHCWPVDPRYQYTGRAWYRRTFPSPENPGDRHVRLEFGAVFARARVWLNGTLLGAHEGGYTPFGFDVTRALMPGAGASNVLALEVDSSWSTKTMPGARPGVEPTSRLYPWWDFGGIVRPVALIVSPAVYVQKQRITAMPDLASGTAAVEATVWVRNTTARPAASRLRLTLARLDGDREIAVTLPSGSWGTSADTPPGETTAVTLKTTVPRDAVRLWDLDRPTLYRVRAELTTASAGADAHDATFGIRRFEVRGTELHLNGRAVRLGGANRPSDDPKFGLIEPSEVVERDLRMMKAAGMELQRITHYAPPSNLLDLADRLGMLIVAEAANWQLQPPQMDDPAMRADFEHQMREMVERDWNHPSVVAWSVGNEYVSDAPAGVRWTKDMAAYVRTIDPTRPITFATNRAYRPTVARPEDEGSHYVDFVSINTYAPPDRIGAVLDLMHQRYPNKPIFISEFGLREDKIKSPEERRHYFRGFIEAVRQRPFVAGASVWTFQDYRSRFWDTAPNGYRPWGLVDQHRVPREAHQVVIQAFAAARIVEAPLSFANGRLIARVRVEARPDFPARPLSGLTLRLVALQPNRGPDPVTVRPLPDLTPGQRLDVALEADAAHGRTGGLSFQIVRPDGSVMHQTEILEPMVTSEKESW
jgi:beta-glucuronidase